ncbi:MAG: ATP-binding cassette domain-containing protein [Verrucomicrobiota bacterium]
MRAGSLTSAGQAQPARERFLEVTGLRKVLGGREVLRGIDLEVFTGETLVILGRSGGGKSVLLKHLIGLLCPDEGRIEVKGRDLCGLDERKLGPFRRQIGILFQDGALFDSMTVGQNVAFPLREGGLREEGEIERRVMEALKQVELAEHVAKMPNDLSGGMRKRAALARTIITRPDCVLYDEPTAGLDPVVSDSINRLIRDTQRALGGTSIVVTHDMVSARFIADRVAYLKEGRIYFQGTLEELEASSDPVISDFIQGRSRGVA